MIILIRNEIIRDRIIVGIHNAQLSEKLQMDSELTLEEAITQAQQAEQSANPRRNDKLVSCNSESKGQDTSTRIPILMFQVWKDLCSRQAPKSSQRSNVPQMQEKRTLQSYVQIHCQSRRSPRRERGDIFGCCNRCKPEQVDSYLASEWDTNAVSYWYRSRGDCHFSVTQ